MSAHSPSAIAALFVHPRGPYASMQGIDPWDESRDARTYAGPHAVVAHPPCQRYGRYWYGGPSAKVRYRKGDDGGCFEAALVAVRTWGGVLEHPAGSAAWKMFGLDWPPPRGGWVRADSFGGWTCRVEQGHYGHRARKATWLYACRVPQLPELVWGPSAAKALIDPGYPSLERRSMTRPPRGTTSEGRAARRAWLIEYEQRTGKAWCCPERLTKRERLLTPQPFAELLVAMARSVVRPAWVAA